METTLTTQHQNQISMMRFVTFNGREIVETKLNSKPIRELSDDEPIRQSLRYIFTLIGLRPEHFPSEIQKVVLIDFIKTELKNFSAEELALSFRLAATKKIDVDITHYQNFSAVYLADVLHAFKKSQQSAMNEYNQQLIKLNQMNKSEELTSEDKQRMFWEYVEKCLFDVWDNYIITGKINFKHYSIKQMFDVLENQLCILVLTADKKMEILEHAKKVINVQIENPQCDTLEKLRVFNVMKTAIESGQHHIGHHDMVINKAREIAIREFFNNIKDSNGCLREMVNSIKNTIHYQ
jgi:hypothetical protein